MSSPNEAKEKYEKYKDIDPFPDISTALLNSGDIEDYVNTTGMIDPFDKGKLKSASYEASIKGLCKYWDKEGNVKNTWLLQEHDRFELEPNSIAFIEVEPTFRLPTYMALRFNLKIKNVYRGLLLGTGPLIDPGFEGKIFIPLHNLTSNTYSFKYGEGLIWIEFTKTSKIRTAKEYNGEKIPRKGEYRKFRDDKKYASLRYYLDKANEGGKIRSSIPYAIEEAKKLAVESDKKAKEAEKTVKAIGIGGVIALIIAVVALVLPAWQLQDTYVDNLNTLRKQINELDYAKNILLNKVEEQKKSISQLQDIVTDLKTAVKANDGSHIKIHRSNP
jgi:deoxycytidine triphosphate deaminase